MHASLEAELPSKSFLAAFDMLTDLIDVETYGLNLLHLLNAMQQLIKHSQKNATIFFK